MPLADLYQEVIMDHYARPRNKGELADAHLDCQEENPLCGDRIRVQARLAPPPGDAAVAPHGAAPGGPTAEAAPGEAAGAVAPDAVLKEVRFSGRGCSISQASASMLTQAMRGRTAAEARRLIARFLAMVRGEPGDYAELGELQALRGVTRYPVRVKCATLAWHVLERALADPAACRASTPPAGPEAGPEPLDGPVPGRPPHHSPRAAIGPDSGNRNQDL